MAGSSLLGLENQLLFVGADGCRAGWFLIALTKNGQWQTEVFPNITELWEKYRKSSLILLDIPIGLTEKGAEERRCDKDARQLLGPPRASSVFRTPCRRAIHAVTHDEAKAINKQLTGKSLPVQTLGITPKILELDSLFLCDASARACIKEIHPEICFWALAGRPMQHNKKKAGGFAERIKVLQSYHSVTEEIVQHSLQNYRRREVAKDDILDALAAAITALAGLNALVSVPDPPEFDNRGLPMQMLYRPKTAR
jgi:predicted RNase H-like nuclease